MWDLMTIKVNNRIEAFLHNMVKDKRVWDSLRQNRHLRQSIANQLLKEDRERSRS
jgi:hypothetical protein